MRIAILSTLSWPFIRRGNRCAYELAVWLAGRGHEVSFLAPAPGREGWTQEKDGLHIRYVGLPENWALTALKVQRLATFALRVQPLLAEGAFDVVQATYPIDAGAASLHFRRTGTPYAYLVYDCNPFHPPLRFGKSLFRRGLRDAGVVTLISDYVNRRLREDTGREGRVVPLPCDLDQFTLPDPADAPPPAGPKIIFCAASLQDPRKRVRLLVEGFAALRARGVDARLRLSGHSDAATEAALFAGIDPAVRARIESIGLGRREDLPARYREAALSVLPSINEAFGLVVTESLACGTPVVGTASGAISEILDDPGVGLTFPEDASASEVADALLRGLRLADDPATRTRCRRHVEERYAWSRIGGVYEGIYRELVAGRAGREVVMPVPAPDSPKPSIGRAVTMAPAAPRRPRSAASAIAAALRDLGSGHEHWFELEAEIPGVLALLRAGVRSWSLQRVVVPGHGPSLLAETLGQLGAEVVRGDFPPGSPSLVERPGFVLAIDPTPELLATLAAPGAARSFPSGGGVALLVRNENPVAGALAAGGFEVVVDRPASARAPYVRSFGSTPLKTILRAALRAATAAALPASRTHRLVLALRPADR